MKYTEAWSERLGFLLMQLSLKKKKGGGKSC